MCVCVCVLTNASNTCRPTHTKQTKKRRSGVCYFDPILLGTTCVSVQREREVVEPSRGLVQPSRQEPWKKKKRERGIVVVTPQHQKRRSVLIARHVCGSHIAKRRQRNFFTCTQKSQIKALHIHQFTTHKNNQAVISSNAEPETTGVRRAHTNTHTHKHTHINNNNNNNNNKLYREREGDPYTHSQPSIWHILTFLDKKEVMLSP